MRLFRRLVVIAAYLAVANLLARSSSSIVGKDGGVDEEKKRRLLVIGQSIGYQHESISTAMVTLYNLGRSSKSWDAFFRTDCANITKKPLSRPSARGTRPIIYWRQTIKKPKLNASINKEPDQEGARACQTILRNRRPLSS